MMCECLTYEDGSVYLCEVCADGLMSASVSFFVPGRPIPKGSKRALVLKNSMRAVMVEQAGERLKSWNSAVYEAACNAWGNRDKLVGPVGVRIHFYLPRPKAHYNARGVLKRGAPCYCSTKPDAGKLARAIEDVLTNVIYRDDCQICIETLTKSYAERTGAQIQVWPLEQPEKS